MDIGPALAGSPVPVVIDHLGRIDAGLGPSQPAFEALRRLLDNPRFWVKLSGLDRSTRLGPPYDDALPYARQLMADAGDRVLWGNDWPHPNHPGPLPDEQQLVDVIEAFAPTAAQRQALLVDNPQRLYGFGD
jgi:2-pyrone-4,6-dicarboxylate lactonase